MWLGNSGMPNCGTPGQTIDLSSSGLNLCFLEPLHTCAHPHIAATCKGAISTPPFNSPANSCHTGFCLSLSWWIFISHSIICQSLSGQMPVEGQELWVVEIPRGVGGAPTLRQIAPSSWGEVGWGKFSSRDTEGLPCSSLKSNSIADTQR